MNDFQTLDQVHERLEGVVSRLSNYDDHIDREQIANELCCLLDDIQRAAEVEPSYHETWEGVAGDTGHDWDNMDAAEREVMKTEYLFGYKASPSTVIDDNDPEAMHYGYEAARWKIPAPRFDSYEDAARSDT